MQKKNSFYSSHRLQKSGRECERLGAIVEIGRRLRRRYYAFFLFAFLVIGSTPLQLISQPLAAGNSKFLGVGTASNIWSKLNLYWNQVTPGNDGKWGSVEPVQGVYNWAGLDNIYNYAQTQGFLFKDHNLVWISQQPTWIASVDSATQRAEVEEWIRLVGQRYPKMWAIDVVNEPMHGNPPYAKAIGGTGTTGWDWVVQAFQWARQYCAPGVKLLVNEYSVLQSGLATTNYMRLIDTLMVRGLIDGIGIQGHTFEFFGSGYTNNIDTIKANLNRIGTLGLPIYMSEFDMNSLNDTTQLQDYKTYFPIFWENQYVKGITLWGYIQFDVWNSYPYTYLLRSDGSERPALGWLRTYVQRPIAPQVVSPIGTTGERRNTLLVWHSTETAVTYHLQVSLNGGFSPAVVDTIVNDTIVQLSPLASNTKFYWQVSAMNDYGEGGYSPTASFTTGDQILSVKESGRFPTTFALQQNYPNPFNPTTQIRYAVPQSAYVSLKVYNLLGQEVATLFAGMRRAGNYVATFDGAGLGSGVYFYQLRTNDFVGTKKLTLLK
jgi:endo-1,4-beta-xylanase